MANISTLTVNLVAETARFTAGLKKTQREANQFSNKVRRSMLPLVGAVAAVTSGLLLMTRQSIRTADQIGKTAKAVGISAEALQELRFAAGQSGVEIRGIDDSIRRFNRRLGEFANSGGGPAAKAIRSLGVNVLDASGKLRGTESVFNDVVRNLADVESEAQKSALAAQLFGDDFGPKLLPLLNSGTEGIADLRKEARDLGIVLSNETVRSAEAAEDRFGRLEAVVKGNFTKAFAENAETIASATEALTEFVIGAFKAANATRKFFGLLTPREEVTEEIDKLTARLADLQDQLLNPRPTRTAVFRPGGAGIVQTPPQPEPFRSAEIERQIDVVNGKLAEQRQRLEAINKAQAEIEKLGAGLDSGGFSNPSAVASVAGVGLSDDLKRRLDDVKASVQGNIDIFDTWEQEATRAFESTRTPVERFNAQVQALLQNPFIDTDLQERSITQAIETLHDQLEVGKQDVERFSEFTAQAARNIQDAFADFFFDPFNDGLKGLLESFTDTIRRMAANLIASDLLNFLGGFGGPIGGFFSLASGSLGPPAALGGFRRGRPFIAGENGPEVVNPGPVGAMVTPMGGGAPTFFIENNISGANDPQSTRRLLEENNRLVIAEVFDRLDRNDV